MDIKDITELISAIGIVLVSILQILQQLKLQTVARDVHTIELATNSMKDQLIEKTESEALARGGIEERARADIRDKKER